MGFPHDIKGEGIYAFVVVMDGVCKRRGKKLEEVEKEVADEAKKAVRNELAAFAVPDVTLVCSSLPKTRSGKIMRRLTNMQRQK